MAAGAGPTVRGKPISGIISISFTFFVFFFLNGHHSHQNSFCPVCNLHVSVYSLFAFIRAISPTYRRDFFLLGMLLTNLALVSLVVFQPNNIKKNEIRGR